MPRFPMNAYQQGQMAKADNRSERENPYSMFSQPTNRENWSKGFTDGNWNSE